MIRTESHILIVDDDEDDFFLTSDLIQDIPNQKFVISWANSYKDAIVKLSTQKFDICFFDYLLGDRTGIDLLKAAIEMGIESPIILLTGKGDYKIDSQATELGAMDYMVKGELDIEKIERGIRYAIGRADSMKRVKNSREQLKFIFDKMKDAILLKRPRGSIFYHNEAATKLLDYTEEDIKQLDFYSLFVLPADYERYHVVLNSQPSIEEFETWLVKKDGEKIQCSIDVSKHLDDEGKEYYLIVIQDITSRKKIERDKLLAEKSASTARLVRMLAHEVRNPLTNIHLSLDQLEPELPDEELKLFIDVIRRNGHRINSMITELLNSFRPQEAVLKQSSIHQILDSILADAQDRINLKRITLEKHYGEDCFLQLDESKIKIALFNLVINAIEAMEDETGVLKVSTHVAGNKCFVEIADNGAGITPENLNKLFEPYFTSKPNGLGLGLASTFTILQSHNANIETESEVGKGTTFTITFPL